MDLSWLSGRCKTSFYHSTNPVLLKQNEGDDVDLASFCKSKIPPCRLNPLLFNGHLQTAWTTLDRVDIPIIYRRKIFESDHPTYHGSFAVDFVVQAGENQDNTLPPRTTYFKDQEFAEFGSLDSKPMLITLHGLSGGSQEIYLRHVIEPLVSKSRDWEACVVNSRGCAMSKISSSVLYNARSTWDVRQVIKWLRQKFPNRPLFAVGYSLGGNILSNYVGEEGSNCELKAAVVCSNPWNLEFSSLSLMSSWFGREVYARAMGTSMRSLFERHVDEISKNQNIDIEKVRKAKYLADFDRYVQAPTWGYPTEGAYYRDASSSDALLAIKIPFLAINAEDDPICTSQALPYEEFKQNPYTVLCTTSWGGHLGWYEPKGQRWFARAIVAFFENIAKNFDVANAASDNIDNDDHISAAAKAAVFDPMQRRWTPRV